MALTNLPSSYYIDDDVFDAERSTVFASSWQYLGPAGRISQPGTYIARRIAGIPVLVIHGRDKVTRGFRNACRHRGAPIVDDGEGRCPKRLRCPYHLWTYSEQGELVDAPWFGDESDIDLDQWPLAPISVEVFRGLLFVSISPVNTLQEQLGDTIRTLEDVPIHTYQHGADAMLEFDANWKIYTDNFVEGYHIPGIHPAFYNAIDFENFNTEAGNGIVKMTAPTDSELFYEGRWYWMWPNWTLSLYPQGMSTSRINPTSAGHTELHYNFYFSNLDANQTDDRATLIERNLDVIREDFSICLGVHHNHKTGNYTPGPLSPKHELGVAWFQEKLLETLKS